MRISVRDSRELLKYVGSQVTVIVIVSGGDKHG